MKKDIQFIAEKFSLYSQLGWWERWKLRHFLRWIFQDATSLEFLFDLERKLNKKTLPTRTIYSILINATIWYNREDHENRFVSERINPEKRSHMMQIVAIFLEKGYELNHSYRGLIVAILNAGDKFARQPEHIFDITAEQLRLEAAEVISNLCQKWGDWHPYTSKNESWCNWSNWYPYIDNEAKLMLGCLEEIAQRLNAEQFTIVCRNMVQVLGAKTALTLLSMSADFAEFERLYKQVLAQLRWWDSRYDVLLSHPKNIAELDENLTFLEKLAQDTQIIKYLHYSPTKSVNWKLNTLLLNYIKSACWNQDWRRVLEFDVIKEGLLQKVEEDVVREQLRIIWNDLHTSFLLLYAARKRSEIKWEFDSFTDYIPYGEQTPDWTVDSMRNRRYWNWQHGEHLELMRFFDTLKPKLLSIFRSLTFSENEILFRLLPNHLSSMETYQKEVNIPVAWKKSVETFEGYNKYAGNYSETVEVARPIEFVKHTFTFERLNLQDVTDLLDNLDKIREAIQAYKSA